MMRSGNPTLSDRIFNKEMHAQRAVDGYMTIEGTVNKTALLLTILMIAATFTWNQTLAQGTPTLPIVAGGTILGFIMALVTMFKKNWSPITTPLYAFFEGIALGAISAMYEMQFGGIVFQAVGITFLILFSLLLAYKTKIIQATENFKLGIFAATAGIGLLYLVGFILSFFKIEIPLIHQSGPIGIAFSLFVVVIASLNLVMDFDFIENAAAQKSAPKYMEWYGAFGLIVTLVWLYLEILRLLSKIQRRD